ncbi:MAG: hypothetical protein COT91_02940 [Candidatus Doudnabacteria bacterium CG10_big_fil_rev_8_21_14_0_10_41_10]|uniref:Uncharacterized protein n=1 Tax=Candidatus Doudnabacteria bacterium CG10_big_fil_rev_8_21_14_0_10_41_10 TaxID=1974551 RepID=A0A2H0VDI4_9BACT|nr:MAG: hypothetical protein COT91_02940 [Candidatus Doudnabacteria bacterium CG10_big_fil_rev_8_21_14_0_10_41_10]
MVYNFFTCRYLAERCGCSHLSVFSLVHQGSPLLGDQSRKTPARRAGNNKEDFVFIRFFFSLELRFLLGWPPWLAKRFVFKKVTTTLNYETPQT